MLLVSLGLFVMLGCRGPLAERAETETDTVSRQVYLMGTVCSLTARGEDRASESTRLERFVEILEGAEAELSTWRQDTPLSRFNRQPLDEPSALTPSLCRLFAELFDWNRQTEGAFDPAIGPLIDAWAIRKSGRIPDSKELGAALVDSGLRGIRFSSQDCTATRLVDTWIDSGAFGKGEALDRIRQSPEASLGPWLVNLGGQVAVSGAKEGDAGWQVDLADPARREWPVMTLELKGGSLATSGGSERDVESEGVRVGHILDPRTGRPALFRGSVTVWHESALVADILSTALFVLGPGKGREWAEKHGVAALFLAASSPESGKDRPSVLASTRFLEIFPTVEPEQRRDQGP